MTYTHLSSEERGKIEAWLFEDVSQSEIAHRLGRHRSTISREIKRNSEPRKPNSIASLPYQASSANNLASMRKANCGTTTKATVHNVKTIKKYLDMKWSPEQIANAVRSIKICRNTIYNWIYKKIIDFDIKKLRHHGKRYKRKNKGRVLKRPDSSFYENRNVNDRPEALINCSDFGHWEADSVVSKRGVSACLATFVERKTRKYVAIKMANQDSHCMLKAMKKLVELHPKNSIKSITCDRGNEFVHHVNIGIVEATLGVKIYYANPYSPHERGSNEYHNGLLREYYLKPTDFRKVSQKHLNKSVDAINTRPRKTLKWRSANYRFESYFKSKK